MQFIDEATIHVKGGCGGAGSVHWRREKFIPQGGPDGGDGGSGGAVILVSDPNINTLIDLSYNPHIFAKDGEPGGENLKTGANGENIEIKVPVGTQVFYNEKIVADFSKPNMRWIAARGGRGGKGNTHFKTASNQAPDYSQPGIKGEEKSFRLVLKSIADVGLVGLPNAGKSTLVKSVSAAKPKVADYPFTTLTPELGVVLLDDKRRFVIADIPGIIEGAHQGKGLGLEFLRHIERTKVLCFVIDVTQTKSYKDYINGSLEENMIINSSNEAFLQLELLLKEVKSYAEELLDKPSIVIFSKCDLTLVNEIYENFNKNHKIELDHILISSGTKVSLSRLCQIMWEKVDSINSNLSG